MWRRNANNSTADQTATSIIDQGCEFEGRFRCVGTLIVNGKFRGEIVSCDTLLLGEAAELEADVQVGTAVISGQVTGNIAARERVELRASARIAGDIATPALVLEEGVVFDGNCRMRSDEVAAAQKSS
ncbi:MAG TPA: polymer-forming cytoskeletal protein [Candidatus Binatia bacterium]|jgi:cytoskeletal protein CcmA (bactofilin family)